MNNTNDLTRGHILEQLLKMALPLIGTSFIQTAYSVIDMIWIGRLGTKAVAAVGTASFMINLAMAVATIVITGSGIKISQLFGAKTFDKIKVYVSNGLIVSLVQSFFWNDGCSNTSDIVSYNSLRY